MADANGLKETMRVTAPVASNTLSVNVFTAPGKAMVGERPRPFGEPLGFDPATSTLIFGEHDAVLVDAMTTVAEAEALADWIALHNRNLETIYINNACAFRPLLRFERSARPFSTRSGDRNAQGGGGHTDVFVSPSAAVSPPNVPWASAHEVGWT
jgi:hypothetical protein